ncbi:branched-chain alpha-ketoacid dehydrogenase [Tribonema minus]|uniref:Protein-serine/threonine kinase n=1 Tax=Tribonema minus TaxID=303371 RepID=A0A836CJJ3_9STRA|nr:branched-chain alpha-ketoacid dehydrogenase [Tribonema minus]
MAGKVRLQREERRPASVSDDTIIQRLAKEQTTRLSLRDLHSFSDGADPKLRIQQAAFLHRELPIRFAQRAVELQNLPFGLSEKKAVKDAAGWYKEIVLRLMAFPEPATAEQEEQYGNMLASLLLAHAQVPQALSKGVMELKASGALTLVEQHRVDQILNSFFLSRIALRFLIEQYIASKRHRPGFRGMIQSECSPVEVAHKAAADVARLCRYHLGFAPEVQVFGKPHHTFTAVPSHLYYIMCELLKNSCRATAVHFGAVGEDGSRRPLNGLVLPPIKVIVARGREDMAIKVMDEGGGIKRSDLQHVWSYMFSSAPQPRRQLEAELDAASTSDASGGHGTFAFAGYGMGLPLSRLYARYFGGSLKLRPMEGYGTDAYLHLHRYVVDIWASVHTYGSAYIRKGTRQALKSTQVHMSCMCAMWPETRSWCLR